MKQVHELEYYMMDNHTVEVMNRKEEVIYIPLLSLLKIYTRIRRYRLEG